MRLDARPERTESDAALWQACAPAAAHLAIVSVCRTLPTREDPVAGIFVLNRLKAMARRADVRVLQPVSYFPVVKPLPVSGHLSRSEQGLSIEPVPTFYLPGVLKPLDGHWFSRSAARTICRLQRRQHIDLIDAHFGYPDGVGWVRAGTALGVPAFVTIRGLEAELLTKPAIGVQLVRALNAAAGCISVSHSLARLAVEHGVDARRIRVIPNGIDRSVFRPGLKDAARRQLGVDPNARLVVSVGHLISRKRHHVLVRALAGLRRLHPGAELVIAGGTAYEHLSERSYPEELARIARESGVAEHVRILGPVSQLQVNSWLQAADVFALATRREGCCNAVLEALGAGRPVITTAVGDNARFVYPGVNGALVPVDDVAGFERALDDALERSWDASSISRGLRATDWNQVAKQVLQFFRDRLNDATAGCVMARG